MTAKTWLDLLRLRSAFNNTPHNHNLFITTLNTMRQLTEHWWITIDPSFQSRIEDESLVFWNDTHTVWLNCWGDGKKPTKQDSIEFIKEDANDDGKLRFEHDKDGVYRIGYTLNEEDEDGEMQESLYAFAVTEGEYMQIAVYYDHPSEDYALAEQIALSVEFKP
jgi:hypothetical protein